jgi:hypothetical protein
MQKAAKDAVQRAVEQGLHIGDEMPEPPGSGGIQEAMEEEDNEMYWQYLVSTSICIEGDN